MSYVHNCKTYYLFKCPGSPPPLSCHCAHWDRRLERRHHSSLKTPSFPLPHNRAPASNGQASDHTENRYTAYLKNEQFTKRKIACAHAPTHIYIYIYGDLWKNIFPDVKISVKNNEICQATLRRSLRSAHAGKYWIKSSKVLTQAKCALYTSELVRIQPDLHILWRVRETPALTFYILVLTFYVRGVQPATVD